METSMTSLYAGKLTSKKTSIEKREDEAMDGDGVVTKKHMKKK